MHGNRCMLMKVSVAISTADGQLSMTTKLPQMNPALYILLAGEQIVHVINVLFG